MGTRTTSMGRRPMPTPATPLVLLATSSLLLMVQAQSPSAPGFPPPPPANAYFFSRSLGTSIPLEGAVVGAVVGGTVLAIFIWFSVRYCCFFGRSTRFLSMEMTATRRHEREQQRHRRRRPASQQQQQQQDQQQQQQQQQQRRQGTCLPGPVGVPEAVFSLFPLREYSQTLHMTSPKQHDSGLDSPAPPPAQPPPPPSTSWWWWRVPRITSQAPPLVAPVAAAPPPPAGAGAASSPQAPGAQVPPPSAAPPEGQGTEDHAQVAITLEPHADAPQCPICLSNFKHGIMLRRLPCSHEFHQTCIDSWMLQHRTCPLCRLTLYEHQEGS